MTGLLVSVSSEAAFTGLGFFGAVGFTGSITRVVAITAFFIL